MTPFTPRGRPQAGLNCGTRLTFLCVYTAPWGRPKMKVSLRGFASSCFRRRGALLVIKSSFLFCLLRTSERARHTYLFFGLAPHLGPLSAFSSKLGRPETTLAFTSKLGRPETTSRAGPNAGPLLVPHFDFRAFTTKFRPAA